MALQLFPLRNIYLGVPRSFIMRVVDVLYHSLAGMQHVGVRDVVKKQQQVIGAAGQRLVILPRLRRVLPDVPRSRGRGAVHADALAVGAVPLSPAVMFR